MSQDDMDKVASDFLDTVYCAVVTIGAKEVHTEEEIRRVVINTCDAEYLEECESKLNMSLAQFMASSEKFQSCGRGRWKAVEWAIYDVVGSTIAATKDAEKAAKGRGRGNGRGGRGGGGGTFRGAGDSRGGFRGGFRGRGTPTGTYGAAFRGINQPKRAPPPRTNFPSQRPDSQPFSPFHDSRGNADNLRFKQDNDWNDRNNQPSTSSNFTRNRGFDQQNGYPSRSPSPQRPSPGNNVYSNQDARNQYRDQGYSNQPSRINGGGRKSDDRDYQKKSSRQDRWDSGLQNNGNQENRRPNYNLRPTSPGSRPSTSASSYKDPLHHKIIVSNDAPAKPSTSRENVVQTTIVEHPKIMVKTRGVLEKPQERKNVKIPKQPKPQEPTIPGKKSDPLDFHSPESQEFYSRVTDDFRISSSPSFSLEETIARLATNTGLSSGIVRLKLTYLLFEKNKGDYCYQNGSSDVVINLLHVNKTDRDANLFKGCLLPKDFEKDRDEWKVQICRFFSFQRFSVRFADTVEEFEKMEREIQDLTKERNGDSSEEPDGGWNACDGCLVKMKDHDSQLWRWTRGYIDKIDGAYFRVLLLDYGYVIMTKADNLRLMPQKFINLPAYSVPCTLASEGEEDAGISSDEWSEIINGYADRTYLQVQGRNFTNGIPFFKADIFVESLGRVKKNILDVQI